MTGLSVSCSCSQMEAGTNGLEVQDGFFTYMPGTFAGSAKTVRTGWAHLALQVASLSWATLGLLKAGDLRIVRFLTLRLAFLRVKIPKDLDETAYLFMT